MSIYSELVTLFRLSEQLKEFKEYDNLDKNDIDNIKYLSDEFIDSCNNILSVTNKTDDENFMRNSFLNSNYHLLEWICKYYCPINKQNLLNNLLYNLKNENLQNIHFEDNNNKKDEINNDININTNNKKFQSENDLKNSAQTDETIDFTPKINIPEKNNIDYNTSIKMDNCQDIITSTNLSDNNIDNINEINDNNQEEDEDEEEEEEEDDDNDESDCNKCNNNENSKNNKSDIDDDNQKIEITENINENNEIIEENQIKNENEQSIKNDDEIQNLEEEENESNEENEKLDIKEKIKEKENKFNELTNKTLKEYLELFYSEENGNENFNDLYMNLKELMNFYDKFESKIQEKILTFLCIIFPFCSYKQKENLSQINIEEKIKIYLSNTLLYFEGENKLYNLLISIPSKKDKKTSILEINRNLSINSESELFTLYQFFVIYTSLNSKKERNLKTFDGKFYLREFYFISFKIYFILSHQELYPCISGNILSIFKRLLFIKKFYSSAFTKKIEEPYIISQINIFEEKYKEYGLDQIKNELFEEDELNMNNKVIEYVKYFYKIDETIECNLLYYSINKNFERIKWDYNFLGNISDIIYLKYNLINKEKFPKMRNNLICLEKNIRNITKQLNRINSKNNGKYDSCYSIQYYLKNIYDSFISELKKELEKNIHKNLVKRIKFYPIILFLPFLYLDESENKEKNLNIFIDLSEFNNPKSMKKILSTIGEYLKKYNAKKKYDEKNYEFILKYKEINIKIIFIGYGLYIQSILLREYSLMDQRLPILILTLNHFLNKLGLLDQTKVNSNKLYFFYYILIVFLQEIINPPILPKILSEDEIEQKKIIYRIKINEGKIEDFFDKNIQIPKIIFDKKKIKKIYDEKIGKNENKNRLSCSELFLKFLEFFIYYYKFDSIYVILSHNYEGFNSINNNLNPFIFDEEKNIPNFNDLNFRNYNFKEFYDKIKKGHDILINSGSFDGLDALNKYKNKIKK